MTYRSIKRAIKAAWAALWGLGPGLAGRALRRARPGVRILFYHRVAPLRPGTSELEVPPEVFARQMETLVAAGYEVLPLKDLPARLGAGESPGVSGQRPAARPRRRDAVAITFDDGYRDNLEAALPVLVRLGLPATVFVTTGFVESGQPFPWMVEGEAAATADSLPLDWAGVEKLSRSAVVDVQSHGVTHRNLPDLDPAEAMREMVASAAAIEAHTGRRPEAFCYPSGAFDARSAALSGRAGYRLACTCLRGLNRPGTPLLALRRTAVESSDTPAVFLARLDGAFDWTFPAWLKNPIKRVILALERRRGSPREAGRGGRA